MRPSRIQIASCKCKDDSASPPDMKSAGSDNFEANLNKSCFMHNQEVATSKLGEGGEIGCSVCLVHFSTISSSKFNTVFSSKFQNLFLNKVCSRQTVLLSSLAIQCTPLCWLYLKKVSCYRKIITSVSKRN